MPVETAKAEVPAIPQPKANANVASTEEQEKEPEEYTVRPKSSRVSRAAKEGSYAPEVRSATPATEPTTAAGSTESIYGTHQPSSYWSVPEKRDFPMLVSHFGKDFEGIANHMKSKTTVMVSVM